MRNHVFFFLFLSIAFKSYLNAQILEVSVGPSYSQQAYFDISSGETIQIENDAWDIAFSNAGVQDAGIFINESSSLMETGLKLFVTDITDWNQTIDDISSFNDEAILYNQKENWIEGAFNSIKDPQSPFDYGWGEYNPALNVVEGNKIFVIQDRQGDFLKLTITSLIDGVYSFKYANLDGTNEISKTIAKNDAGENSLVYFSLRDEQIVSIPYNYDLIFQRYSTSIDDGNGTLVDYTVTGVLLGPNTKGVVAQGVDPANVTESDYKDLYSSSPKTIGHDWKFFDFNIGWIIDSERAQFVKTKHGELFKIVFYDFEGSSTGITTLEKTSLGLVNNIDKDFSSLNIEIFPNPASDFLTISGQAKNAELLILDGAGKLILAKKLQAPHDKINIQNLSSGLHRLLIINEDEIASKPVIIHK